MKRLLLPQLPRRRRCEFGLSPCPQPAKERRESGWILRVRIERTSRREIHLARGRLARSIMKNLNVVKIGWINEWIDNLI